MDYRLRLAPKAGKDLVKIKGRDKTRILLALRGLEEAPFSGKKLKGEFNGLYSIRVWPYRIIYATYKKELLILVIRISHRQKAYK
ncbi:type II toxin-antitoxin system RelE/ParE family toxin [Candidatus Azambacteria bacterium]|nr:type II toxin-antitoxin system RelE/ParE family toxin [Candidatus Azambacteria bacterium]